MRKFSRAARGLGKLVPEVERLATSPFVRARQTAEILNDVAGWPAPEFEAGLAAGASPESMLNAVLTCRHRSVCALVGHEPDLSLLTAALIGMRPRNEDAVLFKKGGVAMLTSESGQLGIGAWTLRWLLPPRVLRRL